MTTHNRVRNAMRELRDEGKAAVIKVDSGKIVITADTKDAKKPKCKNQRFVETYRIHDRRGGMLKSRRVADPSEIKLTLQRHEFEISDPESVL